MDLLMVVLLLKVLGRSPTNELLCRLISSTFDQDMAGKDTV